jgi:hypothetical protein
VCDGKKVEVGCVRSELFFDRAMTTPLHDRGTMIPE